MKRKKEKRETSFHGLLGFLMMVGLETFFLSLVICVIPVVLYVGRNTSLLLFGVQFTQSKGENYQLQGKKNNNDLLDCGSSWLEETCFALSYLY